MAVIAAPHQNSHENVTLLKRMKLLANRPAPAIAATRQRRKLTVKNPNVAVVFAACAMALARRNSPPIEQMTNIRQNTYARHAYLDSDICPFPTTRTLVCCTAQAGSIVFGRRAAAKVQKWRLL
jgi:hypothetical protein